MDGRVVVSEIYKCAGCNTEVSSEYEFCPKCGLNLKEHDIQTNSTNNPKPKSFRLIGIIITLFVIIITASINTFLKNFSNQSSLALPSYDDWENISLYEIGITLKAPTKFERESINSTSDAMDDVIYSGGVPGFQIVILGSRIQYGYYYDLEKGVAGSMKYLESDGNLTNLNYTMSEWSWTKFENKIISGTYISDGKKGELLSLFGKKDDRMFSVLILISPPTQHALDLGHLLLTSIEFK